MTILPEAEAPWWPDDDGDALIGRVATAAMAEAGHPGFEVEVLAGLAYCSPDPTGAAEEAFYKAVDIGWRSAAAAAGGTQNG